FDNSYIEFGESRWSCRDYRLRRRPAVIVQKDISTLLSILNNLSERSLDGPHIILVKIINHRAPSRDIVPRYRLAVARCVPAYGEGDNCSVLTDLIRSAGRGDVASIGDHDGVFQV
ncbi:unnamed protein product, partial [Heligmosomoides polygyrus]|uniref:TP6A_N domain-containing protein n=1 Tax=Heligmosomoides polygyrus TaxID=6339 RepID=A0A183F5F3_HELPZ